MTKKSKIIIGALSAVIAGLLIALIAVLASSGGGARDDAEPAVTTTSAQTSAEPPSEPTCATNPTEPTEGTCATDPTDGTCPTEPTDGTCPTEPTAVQTTTPSVAVNDELALNLIYSHSWQEGDRILSNIRVEVTNNSDKAVTEWRFEIPVAPGTIVREGQVMRFTVEGDKVIITEDANFNRSIAPGETLTGAWFVTTSDEPIEWLPN
jgi:hypothetical protein